MKNITVFAHNRHTYMSLKLLQIFKEKIFFPKFQNFLTFLKVTIDVPNVRKYCYNMQTLKVETNPQILSVLASPYDKNSFFYDIMNLNDFFWIFSFFAKNPKKCFKMPKFAIFLPKIEMHVNGGSFINFCRMTTLVRSIDRFLLIFFKSSKILKYLYVLRAS